MNRKLVQTIPNLFSFSGRKPHFFAFLLAFCILINSFCPRAVIELKNYDVVVLAMGSQSVFLHLFALPSKVSIELANMLFNDKTQHRHAKNSGNKSKNTSNSSADFSILSAGQGQNLEKFQAGVWQAAVFTGCIGADLFQCHLKTVAQFQTLGMAYFLFILLFFSRPRGETVISAINMIINISKPGLSLIPGFSFGGMGFSFPYCVISVYDRCNQLAPKGPTNEVCYEHAN